jgi:protein-disulfide isomerase
MICKKAARLFLTLAVAAVLVPSAAAQSLIEQQEEMLKELRQIRQLLERLAGQQPAQRQAPVVDERVKLPLVSGFSLGKPDAPVTIVEYTDLQCPFCKRFNDTTFADLKKTYIDTGKVRFVTKDYPLDFHPFAKKAAAASRCGGEQGKFWEVRKVLVTNADKLGDDMIAATARDLKLDMKKFQTCLGRQDVQADIQKDLQEGSAAGVNGTPTFVIGATSAGEMDGVRLVGAQPLAAFEAKIKQLLEAQPAPTR